MSDLLKKAGQQQAINLDPSGAIASRQDGKGGVGDKLQVGFGDLVPGAQKCPQDPSTKPLSPDQLRDVAGVGGVGISGTGELAGTVALVKKGVVNFGIATLSEVPMLITANRGNSAEVAFELDIDAARARALAGQDVSVSGLIEKTTANAGKITGAKIEATDGFPFGTWKSLSGKVENVQGLVGIGGETRPQGSYLNLDQPINMGGEKVERIFIQGKNLADGAQVELTGRLDQLSWGGVARPETKYVALTGVTNQTAGEPTFDGEKFISSAGKELHVASYNVPNMYDGPSTLFVMDQGADKAWVGTQGVFLRPGMNHFFGFRESRAIENPTAADRNVIGTNAVGKLVDKQSGEELVLLSERGQGMIADGMHTGWYRNERSGDVYRIQNGGIAGFSNLMDQIIRAPQSPNGPPGLPV